MKIKDSYFFMLENKLNGGNSIGALARNRYILISIN